MRYYIISSLLSAGAIILLPECGNRGYHILAYIFSFFPGLLFIAASIKTKFLGKDGLIFKSFLFLMLWFLSYYLSIASWGFLTFIIVGISALILIKIKNWTLNQDKEIDHIFLNYGLIAGVLGEVAFYLIINLFQLESQYFMAASAPAIIFWQIAIGLAIKKMNVILSLRIAGDDKSL